MRRLGTVSASASRADAPLAAPSRSPRGWHLYEPRVLVDGVAISGSIFDFALYFFHNAHEAVKRGFGPYFYLPKMEHYLEARLWNDIFSFGEAYIKLAPGTVRATVVRLSLRRPLACSTHGSADPLHHAYFPAAHRDAAGRVPDGGDHLRAPRALGRPQLRPLGLRASLRARASRPPLPIADALLRLLHARQIFSYIKKLRNHKKHVLPDRSEVTMTVPFMDAYVRLLIKTCHRRKVAAMGGMSAQIPIKNDPKANDAVTAKVTADKVREVTAGHDGTWVAHPALVKIAMDVFNEHMLGPNQVRRASLVVRSPPAADADASLPRPPAPLAVPRPPRGGHRQPRGPRLEQRARQDHAPGPDRQRLCVRAAPSLSRLKTAPTDLPRSSPSAQRARLLRVLDVGQRLRPHQPPHGAVLRRSSSACARPWLTRSLLRPPALQEDAATAEIARCQLWQWVHHAAKLDDGTPVTRALVSDVLAAEAQKLAASSPGISVDNVEVAKTYLVGEVSARFPSEFLTSCVAPLPLSRSISGFVSTCSSAQTDTHLPPALRKQRPHGAPRPGPRPALAPLSVPSSA